VGNRSVKRKVVIVYEGRVPNDTDALLKSVADNLRPNEVEIRVSAEAVEPRILPDEQLEAHARERVEHLLDQNNQQVHSPGGKGEGRLKLGQSEAQTTKAWMLGLIANGWKFTVKMLPVIERAAKIFKEIHGG
jgi:hypothetical protein